MKKLMLSTALAGVLVIPAMVAPALAQEVFLATPGEGDVRASEFIGKRLYAAEAATEMDEYQGVQPDWQDIGEVNDVLLGRDGTVDAVLVDIGGFLGMGERQVAVDMGQIRFVSDSATADDPGDYFLVMTATRSQLEAAPTFESAAGTAPATETAPAESAEMPAATETAPADAEATTESAEAPATTQTDPATGTDPTAVAPVSAREGFAAAPPEQITSETLTGTAVYDAADAHVGEISELLIDADGKVTDAVVDVGGFLGIGEKPVALPLSDIEIMHSADTNQLRVFVSMTKEQLEAMPAYEG